MGKVAFLNCDTRLDLPVDRVIDAAKDKLKSVVIIGYTEKDDEIYFATSHAKSAEVLWLLENAKKAILG